MKKKRVRTVKQKDQKIPAVFTVSLFLLLFIVKAATATESNRVVDLEWGTVEGASEYELQFVRILKDQVKKKPAYFTTTEPQWRGRLNFGLYQMRIRTYDERGVPGTWTDPTEVAVKVKAPPLLSPEHKIKILTKSDGDFETTFKWARTTGADRYRIEVRNDTGSFSETREVKEETFTLTLPVAQKYHWKVTAIMPNNQDGEPAKKAQSFILIAKPIDLPVINPPDTKFVESLSWSKPGRSEWYRLFLYKKNKKNIWKKIKKIKKHTSNEYKFDLSQESGDYKFSVYAEAKYTERSPNTFVEFPVKGGLRSPAAIEEAILKDSMEKPHSFYAIASYLLTIMQFDGENRGNWIWSTYS